MKTSQVLWLVVVSCLMGSSAVNASEPPVVNNKRFWYVNEATILMHTFTTSQGDEPIIWGDFNLVNFPTAGLDVPGPFFAANFDQVSAKFTWNTLGSAGGVYQWGVSASNAWGTGQGLITVRLVPLGVPEPGTVSLIGPAVTLLWARARRR